MRHERSSALWGGGTSCGRTARGSGRVRIGLALAGALVAAAVLPWSAAAQGGGGPGAGSAAQASIYVPDALLAAAQASPHDSFAVIVQGDGSRDADHLAHQVAAWAAQANKGLTDAARKADQALQQAQADADRLAARAAAAQASAVAKAARAALSGKEADRKAAAKAAQDAADAQQRADVAQAAVAQAQAADDAANAALSQLSDRILQQQVKDEFSSLAGVAVTLTGDQISKLVDKGDGLVSITPDAPVQTSGWSSKQLWPYVSGSANLWKADGDPATQKQMPSIAIVDSGIQSRPDFGNRIVAAVNLSSLDPSSGTAAGTARSSRGSRREGRRTTPARTRAPTSST